MKTFLKALGVIVAGCAIIAAVFAVLLFHGCRVSNEVRNYTSIPLSTRVGETEIGCRVGTTARDKSTLLRNHTVYAEPYSFQVYSVSYDKAQTLTLRQVTVFDGQDTTHLLQAPVSLNFTPDPSWHEHDQRKLGKTRVRAEHAFDLELNWSRHTNLAVTVQFDLTYTGSVTTGVHSCILRASETKQDSSVWDAATGI